MTEKLTPSNLKPGDKVRATAPWADCWRPGDVMEIFHNENGVPYVECRVAPAHWLSEYNTDTLERAS